MEIQHYPSQLVSFAMFSLFLGPFGADLFYLGYPIWGSLKLATLGGGGLWWAYDVQERVFINAFVNDFSWADIQ